MTRLALVFPGQGSQAAGMAAGLLDTPTGAELLAAAAAEGLDLQTALAGGDESLRATEVAQPALVATELALAALLPAGLDIVGVAGHSVGEYAALAVAGGLPAAEVLRLVIARGRAMAAMTEGTMAAVIGLDAAQVQTCCAAAREAGETVVVANLNAPGQVVISGTSTGIAAAAALAAAAGARRVLPLRVGGAFHSPLMAGAARQFGALLDAAPLAPLRVPLASNVDGAAVSEPAALRDRLRRQLESPVRWTDCLATLAGLGAELLVEVGPGSVLTGLSRRALPNVATASVASAEAARALPGSLGVGV
ncbi:MAG: ACP S-malonyltransferase [Candidatus Dormibacteria bacterium]